MIAGRLDAALRAAGIPIRGVSIGDPDDRATWVIHYAPEATREQIAAGAALLARFDPNAVELVEAEQAAEMRALADTLMIKAFYRFHIYSTVGPDAVITPEMITEANQLLARCFKEAASA